MADGVDYIVCDRCGELWKIGAPAPDPARCRYCQATRLWRFSSLQHAEAHAATVKNGSKV